MTSRRFEHQDERGAVALLALVVLLGLAAVLALTTLNMNAANLRHGSQAREDLELQFLVHTALHQAFNEVENQSDLDGDGGIGSLAVTSWRDGSGRIVGEYAAYVWNEADPGHTDPTISPRYVIRGLAAAPGFGDPRRTRGAEAALVAEASFALHPRAGAISIAGPLTSNPGLDSWDSAGFSIDGNGAPAIVFTHPSARKSFVEDDSIDAQWFSNKLASKISGIPLVTFDRPGTPKEFDAPFVVEEQAAFTSQMLNGYRDALRNYAHGLVHARDDGSGGAQVDYAAAANAGVVVLHQHPSIGDGNNGKKGVQPRISSDFTFKNKTVLIDTSQFYQGGASITDTHADGTGGGAGRTIKGSGTLVILHPLGSFSDNNNGKQFNLDWTGDVFVIGYPKDRSSGVGENGKTDNLLYISRASWQVTGNLVLLTAGQTEASLEMQGANTKRASLSVTGAVLLFGEAGTREAEIDIENFADFQVDGMVGLFGSRVELENQSSTSTRIRVDGTVAMGFPTDSKRDDDLTWEVEGDADFRFDKLKLERAIEGLCSLQGKIDLHGTELESIGFMWQETLVRSRRSLSELQADLQGLRAKHLNTGVDVDLILSTQEAAQ